MSFGDFGKDRVGEIGAGWFGEVSSIMEIKRAVSSRSFFDFTITQITLLSNLRGQLHGEWNKNR